MLRPKAALLDPETYRDVRERRNILGSPLFAAVPGSGLNDSSCIKGRLAVHLRGFSREADPTEFNSTCVERIRRMFLLRPLRFLAQALLLDATPRQLAAGFALGMLIGLVPKGNLIAISLMALFCALRINLAAGTGSIALFAWVGMSLDPISHRVGHYLLTHQALEPFWTSLYDVKFMPWTAYNNTVVLGSLAIGLALLVPVYALSRPVFARFAPGLARFVQKYHVAQVLHGGEVTGNLA
jgi:uncharacterized protein (TIGR03546 family)